MIETKVKLRKKSCYPRLMVSDIDDVIVLFTDDGEGVNVSDNSCIYVGFYSSDWNMCNFIPFNGEITIKNK